MAGQECPRCADEHGHYDWELIWVDNKPFCPYSFTRVYTEEEGEEWTDEQWKEVQSEKLVCIRRASYKIKKMEEIKQ